MSTRISDVINVTAELCDELHRGNGGSYYSPAALDGFIGALSDLLKECPETVRDTLVEMRSTFKGKLTPMDVRIRVTGKITSSKSNAELDRIRKVYNSRRLSGKTYRNRSGANRPIEELPDMLKNLYMSHVSRSTMEHEEPLGFYDWIDREEQANLKQAIIDNPDIIPAGWEPKYNAG